MININPDNLTPLGREFLTELRAKQEKLRLAAIKPVHSPVRPPATFNSGAITAPPDNAMLEKGELPIKDQTPFVFDVKTPMLKVAETLGQQIVDDLTSRKPEPVARPALDWDELGRQARIDEAKPREFMVMSNTNPEFNENYIPPDDGLGF